MMKKHMPGFVRKAPLWMSVLFMGLLVIGCSGANNENKPSDTWIGMTVEQAQKAAQTQGELFRVVEQDGDPLIVTMDYRPGRINARVKDNIIIGYDREGETQSETDNAQSWEQEISPDCKNFFDGCNTCQRTEEGQVMCTERFCETYEQPVCLDEEEGQQNVIE